MTSLRLPSHGGLRAANAYSTRYGDNNMCDINAAIRSFSRAGYSFTQNSPGVTHFDHRSSDKHFTLVEYGEGDIQAVGMKGVTARELLDILPEDWSRQ